MDTKNLILVGGGGHCKSVIDVAECAGFNIRGILDLPEKVGSTLLGYPVLDTDDNIHKYVDDNLFLVTLGHIKNPAHRIALHERIKEVGGHMATLISPTAHVSRHAFIGEGTVVMHHALVNAGATVGHGCIINSFANIEHDAIIGEYCHISTGAMVNGTCTVGSATFIGSGAVMANNTTIVTGCVIAAGAVVRKDLTKKGIYSGNPAILKIKL